MTTTGLRLSLFIGEDDTGHHRPLYDEALRRARGEIEMIQCRRGSG